MHAAVALHKVVLVVTLVAFIVIVVPAVHSWYSDVVPATLSVVASWQDPDTA
jgi:hypothetical protein